ncbi:hypothetical protein [Phenylobacterium sp.]|jgi:hypothetical protein|uniref:hypothetical protein n=1 Tax=Phenylobacterium sp. TaxID=1871053 RepID=UPI002F94BDA3
MARSAANIHQDRGAAAREEAQAKAEAAREAGQARGAEARAEGQARAEEARDRAEERRHEARLDDQRELAFRLTGEDDFLAADSFYFTRFTALNGSGVQGGAIVAFDDETDTITVAISARGLEPDQPHVQHIHGFLDGQDAMTPTRALDSDRDGFIELAEGVPAYGPVLLNLTTVHDNGSGMENGHSHESGLEGFPTAPGGEIMFVESYQLPRDMLGADPMLALREIVLHGMTVGAGAGAGTPGEVDGTAGYKLVLPVASGELTEAGSAHQLRAFANASGFESGWALG